MAKEKVDLLIEKANELITLRNSSGKPLVGKQMSNLGLIHRGSIAVNEGKIVAVGTYERIKERFVAEKTIDASGRIVMPGFVDPHTHLVFAGAREEEFEFRIMGFGYLEILAKGGGILKTMNETRKASVEELVKTCKKTLNLMLMHGTTTVEAKSGYGLNVRDELKCLKVIKQLNDEHPMDIVPTFLGAHAVPPEYEKNAEGYVSLILEEMIPTVVENKLAEFCDVFCEKGVFNIKQSKLILKRGKEYGLKLKMHADEMTQLGGAELAAELNVVSASHLLFSSRKGIKKMAEKGVIGELLPLASFSLMMNRYAPARQMIEDNLAIALGTDYNPSCWVENQQLTIAFACRELRLTPAEAITATTINAAHAIHRAGEVGSLEQGKKADIIILDIPSHKFLGYRFGTNLVETTIKNGEIVVEKGRFIPT